MANKFEERLNNLPYSTDWWERRNLVLGLISDMQCEFDNIDIYWTSLDENEDHRSRFIFFSFDNNLYIWVDGIINGKFENAQLDKIDLRNRRGGVLYSNVYNAPPIYELALQALRDNKLYKED
ncbi:MAG: hypothetical protein UH641_04240 [Bacteroidales bacterium]|nr:hypothetical protein [Bacteroidales bacterium]